MGGGTPGLLQLEQSSGVLCFLKLCKNTKPQSQFTKVIFSLDLPSRSLEEVKIVIL